MLPVWDIAISSVLQKGHDGLFLTGIIMAHHSSHEEHLLEHVFLWHSDTTVRHWSWSSGPAILSTLFRNTHSSSSRDDQYPFERSIHLLLPKETGQKGCFYWLGSLHHPHCYVKTGERNSLLTWKRIGRFLSVLVKTTPFYKTLSHYDQSEIVRQGTSWLATDQAIARGKP